MGPIQSWDDFVDMARRRRGLIILVVILGCIASYFWAANMQHMYRSTEVIQIEQPKIANELARTTVEGSAARRLQLIEQQIMARGNLEQIIQKYDIYGDLTGLTLSEKVDILRYAISISGVAAVREGYVDDGKIAILSISAELESGELAQAVAKEIADRTRELAATQRREQTEETLAFFAQQEKALMRDIAALEDELARFRSENDLTITGGLEMRLTEITSLNESILEIDQAIVTAELARTQIDRGERAATVARETKEIESRLETLTSQRALLVARRDTLRSAIDASPEVERELSNFERRMEQLRNQLNIVSTRRNEAEVGFSLESASQGERMITLEEARVPDYPFTPSRKKRAMMGSVAAVIAGFVLAFLMELRHPVIRSAQQMARETGVTPVVSIPELNVPDDAKSWRQRRAERRARARAGRDARLARLG